MNMPPYTDADILRNYYITIKNHAANMEAGRPWNVGPEVVNNSYIRIFQHHGDPRHLPGSIPTGQEGVVLAPVGIAYVTVDLHARHGVPMQHPDGPPAGDVYRLDAAPPLPPWQREQPGQVYRPMYDGQDTPPYTPTPPARVRAHPSVDDDDNCSCPATPWKEDGPQSPGPSDNKRTYDEYLEGQEDVEMVIRSEASRGWHKCSCCPNGWFHDDDMEEEDGDEDVVLDYGPDPMAHHHGALNAVTVFRTPIKVEDREE